MTLANRLTLFRAIAVFPYALLVLEGERLPAALLFGLAALTDLLDGFVARRRNEETKLGRVLDPIADKMLTITALIALTAVGTFSGWLVAAVVLVAMREVWVAGLREGLIFAGAELPVSAIAKAKTSVQLLALFVLTLGGSLAGYGLFWLSVALTLYTGFAYTRDAFKVLNLPHEDT